MNLFCRACKRMRDLSMFYRSTTGITAGECAECVKSRVAENYRENIEHYRAYEKVRCQQPERRAAASEYQRKRRAKYPGKNKARNAVANAVRDGRLIRQPCEVCGDQKTQAHHDDYRRPLAVRWMCFKCHREIEHGQRVAA
jgi:ribosomal protein S27AE